MTQAIAWRARLTDLQQRPTPAEHVPQAHLMFIQAVGREVLAETRGAPIELWITLPPPGVVLGRVMVQGPFRAGVKAWVAVFVAPQPLWP
ncbi:hypothetical protein D3C84_1001260 [compost metagenome]